jgi:hypothetical protein
MPKFLFTEEFNGLSNDAIVLYSLLRDRHDLSVKNHWVNEEGEVYIIFSRDEMEKMLRLSDKPVNKAVKDLKKHNLLEEQRQGQGKPNLIYLLTVGTPETLDYTKKRRNADSRTGESPSQESVNLRPNKTEIKENEINETYILSKSLSSQVNGENQKEKDRTMTMTLDTDPITQKNIRENEKGFPQTNTLPQAKGSQENPNSLKTNNQTTEDYNTYKEIIQENIEYEHFTTFRQGEVELVDELVNCMLDVICSQGETVKINGEHKSREMVKSQYLRINSMDIDHILGKYQEQRHRIKYIHEYLKTMLYTIKQESGHFTTNAVRADGVVW